MAEFAAWKSDPSRFFGNALPDFEKLRKPWPKDAPFDLVETSYFGFYVPEESINCEIYHWFHPAFNLCSGGVRIFKGIKSRPIDAEYIQYQNYQPMPEDITDCTYNDGLTIKMTGPSEFEIRYDDPKAQTSFEINAKGIMPPAFRHTGGHITQAMKTSGELTLRGKTYKVDSFFTRDRSWGDPRSEERLNVPPIGWHVGVFGEDLAFHTCAFDSPEWDSAGLTTIPAMAGGKNHIWGYVWKKGKLLGVKSTKKLVRHEEDIKPAAIDLEIVDENDETYAIKGEIVARLPDNPWPNMSSFHWCLTKWTMEGESRTGWGDTQEAIYQDFLQSR